MANGGRTSVFTCLLIILTFMTAWSGLAGPSTDLACPSRHRRGHRRKRYLHHKKYYPLETSMGKLRLFYFIKSLSWIRLVVVTEVLAIRDLTCTQFISSYGIVIFQFQLSL